MRRILLKISGELFTDQNGAPFDFDVFNEVAEAIVNFLKIDDIQLSIVVGAGNLWRYRDTTGAKLDRVAADRLGMTATCFNAKLLENALQSKGVSALAVSDFSIPGLLPDYDALKVREELNNNTVCILAGGTGKPFFTTDSCGVLRALELDCELMLKATKVNGVYDSDPTQNKDAKRYESISYDQVLKDSLMIMDLPAIAMARDAALPVLVFDFSDFSNLNEVLDNPEIGTLIQ